MKKTTVFMMFGAACGAFYAILKERSNKMTKACCNDLASVMLDGPEIETAEEEIKACEDIEKAEQIAVNDIVTRWEKENRYRSDVKNIQKDADKAIRMLEIDPDSPENKRLIDLEDKRKAALAASKKALGLTRAENERDKAIREANEKYEKQITYLNQGAEAGSELASITSNLRFAAEKDRDKTIADANKKYEGLKSKYDSKVSEWDEKVLEAKTVREEMLAAGRKRILEQRDARMNSLKKTRNEVVLNARDTVVGNRSEEQNDILERYEDNVKIVNSFDQKVKDKAKELYDGTTTDKRFACYFIQKKISVGTVVGVAAMPLIGLGLAAWKYIEFIMKIVHWMNWKAEEQKGA